MREKFPGWYPKKPEAIAKLWDTAIFVPDANVLLHCLRHTTVVRDELLRLFEALGDALWIPYQVGLEFQRNRLDIEFGALDAYDALLKDQEANIDKARDRLRQLRAHPTIDVQKELAALDMFFSDFKARMETARDAHPSAEIDGVLEKLTKLLEHRIGDKWPPEKLIALKNEGEDRYSKKVPPGYKDQKKDAGEYDKFGDLIIWKDIIAKAKSDKRPVIFISDDAKEDWWWIHRGRKMGPRPELIEEFRAKPSKTSTSMSSASFCVSQRNGTQTLSRTSRRLRRAFSQMKRRAGARMTPRRRWSATLSSMRWRMSGTRS